MQPPPPQGWTPPEQPGYSGQQPSTGGYGAYPGQGSPAYPGQFAQPSPAPAQGPSTPQTTAPANPPGAPAARSRGPRRPAIIGVVVGLVIALAVGAILLATKTMRFGSGAAAASTSTAPITLPDTLAGYPDMISAQKAKMSTSSLSDAKKASALAAQQSNQDKVKALTLAAYQQANPGAAVAYRAYASADLLHFVSVIAVRATYPGLTLGPVIDPAYQGLAVAQQRNQTFGEVQCLIGQTELTVAGKPVDPEKQVTGMCQRSGPVLTVQVYGSSFDGTAGQQTMVSLTNAAWAATNT